jgi:hypothetical protein
MTSGDLVAALENEYDPDGGFIGRVRYGHFDEPLLARLISILARCPSSDTESPDARLVSLVWYIPWIVEWQAQRLMEEGSKADHLHRAREQIFREVERILGVP